MAEGALPRDIWDQGFEEGERRMKRRMLGQASTGLLGGFDIMLGLIVVFSLSGALLSVTTEEMSHAIGAIPFGLAFVYITVGRSELFTENFLVPVGAYFAGRGNGKLLARMWIATLVFNLLGALIIIALVTVDGVLPESALESAGHLGDEFVHREFWPALASAVVAGIAITLFTWLTLAASSEAVKVIIALTIGYVLLLPVLNHAVVGFGEVMLGVMGGQTDASAWDITWRMAVAIVGNTLGGVGFVTMTRLVQVSGEPPDPDHARKGIRDRILLPSAWRKIEAESSAKKFDPLDREDDGRS